MINRKNLLEDLKKLVSRVEADLLARSEDSSVPEIGVRLKSEYDRARAANRTAANYEDWRTDRLTQVAVAWVLSCVFVRFLEDNDLISPPRIAGPGDRLQLARDFHQHHFTSHPRDTDRDFLIAIFDTLQKLPGTADIFGSHNALREIPNWLSGDAAKEILQFFQKVDANTGTLVQDFTDPAWDTRFLGDLYQDLSAYARARYALLQTPHFVESFILDRTLEPALDEFGLKAFKMIDPACGSGHFLIGSFPRILDRWQAAEPATPVRELVLRTLASIHGVDINPFAVAIARFRLLLVAMRACGVAKLADAPAFHLNIECGDSLLHTPLIGGVQELFDKGSKADTAAECDHAYASEDLAAVKAILRHGQYHAVVANPPYIQVNDSAVTSQYRRRFQTCFKHYSLAVPFCEHILRLAIRAHGGRSGFTGQITANTFMKAEFGKKLVQEFLPTVDLTLVVDTSTTCLPGHGTPTVILFARNRPPVDGSVRVVSGTIGEHPTPSDPSRGLVWAAVTRLADALNVNERFGTVAGVPRARLHSHPWSIGGGGAADLKEALEYCCKETLNDYLDDIGRIAHSGEDSAFVTANASALARSMASHCVDLVAGESVRDGCIRPVKSIVFPYHGDTCLAIGHLPLCIERHLWPSRTTLKARVDFGKTVVERGMAWFEYSMFFPGRYGASELVAQAFVATHNQFALGQVDRCVSNQTAPVLLLASKGAEEGTKFGLVWLLNSSSVCFWLKQVCFPKGGDQVGGDGARVRKTLWDEHYNFNSTQVRRIPLPGTFPNLLGKRLQSLAEEGRQFAPRDVVMSVSKSGGRLAESLRSARESAISIRRHQVAVFEELDWSAYRDYGLLDEDVTYSEPVPPINLGERAFEIALARRVAAGETTTTWFERHGSTPITEIPSHWPAEYQALVQKRLDAIQANANINLIEQPEYKRRWNSEPWADQQAAALNYFLLDRLERLFDFDGRMNDAGKPTAMLPVALVSLGQIADAARRDPLFMEAAEVFENDPGFDVGRLVATLVEGQSVPLLPQLRYKATGLRKRADWERTWELQRQEDAIDAHVARPTGDPKRLTAEAAAELKRREVGSIAVPPKYTKADFVKDSHWKLRDKLDVPTERFVSFPGVAGADGSMMVAWAGLDHLQLAKAIGDFYGLVQTELGGSEDPRLVPLLAGIAELIPWVRQWHPDFSADYGSAPADFFEQFVKDEAALLRKTVADVRAWTPPAKAKKTAKKASGKRSIAKRSGDESPQDDEADE